MGTHTTSQQSLTRQERIDLWISRALPKLSGRANRAIIRLSRGRLGTTKRGIPIAVLTTTGRRSGRPRSVPLMYLEDDSRYLVVASNGGYDPPPAWLRNLEANPVARLETGRHSVPVRARVLDRDEKAQLWPRLTAHNPLWGVYQSLTDRQSAVVALEPVADEVSSCR